MKILKRFVLLTQFLTRIPLNVTLNIEEDDFEKSTIFFPLVGLIIGVFNYGLYLVFSKMSDGLLPAIIAILANVVITGALHVDGLADSCDGVFSARSKERMLEIMRDSRVGTHGVIAIAFDFLLRLGVLTSVNHGMVMYLLILSPVVSRTMIAFVSSISVYARKGEGLGTLFIEKISKQRAFIIVWFAIAITFVFIKSISLILILSGLIVALIVRRYFYDKIDGLTGDNLGAVNEIIEITTMITLLFLIKVGVL